MTKEIYLSLGSNLGDRVNQLKEAVRQIAEQVGKLGLVSGIFESESWGFSSEHNFCNCCVSVHTALEPLQVLDAILAIEKGMGRERVSPKGPEDGYADRLIDIDLLFFGNIRFEHPRLILPHPSIAQRRFVLLPLHEIAPGLVHPVLDLSVRQMLDLCDDPVKVWPHEAL